MRVCGQQGPGKVMKLGHDLRCHNCRVLAGLGAVRGPAEESTFRRAFALIRADVLDQAIGAWLHTRATRAGGRLAIAVDGKAVRGARNSEEKPRT